MAQEKDDLEHLGWVDLSVCTIEHKVPESPDPLCFAVVVPDRRYVLRASKAEHRDTWLKALVLWSGVFQAEKQVTAAVETVDLSGGQAAEVQADECLAALGGLIDNVLERVRGAARGTGLRFALTRVGEQEARVNEVVKRIERFKQKAFALKEKLEFQRDRVADPRARLEAIQESHDRVELALGQLGADSSGAAAAVRDQVRQLHEELFRSKVRVAALSEDLAGRSGAWLDAAQLWAAARRAGVPASEYDNWIGEQVRAHNAPKAGQ